MRPAPGLADAHPQPTARRPHEHVRSPPVRDAEQVGRKVRAARHDDARNFLRAQAAEALRPPARSQAAQIRLLRRTEHLDGYLTRQHVDGVLLISLHDDDTLPQFWD